MKQMIFRQLILVCIMICGVYSVSVAQWNPDHSIGTASGKYTFSYFQTPENLIELVAPTYSGQVINGGLTYQWETSLSPAEESFLPMSGFYATQGVFIFQQPLQHTAYYRRKTTENQGGGVIYSNIVKIEVVSVNWEDKNYVREHDVLVPGITTWQAVDGLSIGQKLQTTSYVDGLGRGIEKVDREVAPPQSAAQTVWGDRVQVSGYDDYGRQAKQYPPYSFYPSATSTSPSGSYRSDAMNEQAQYYSNAATYNDGIAYSQTLFDNSPLNRVVNTKSAGVSWANSTGNNTYYELNDASDNIRMLSIATYSGSIPVNTTYFSLAPLFYAANTLFRNRHTNENGDQVVEFVNTDGLLIMKKVQATATPGTGSDGWSCTYYVYDDFQRLRYVIEPEAVKYMDANGWTFTQGILNEMCLNYEYDEKGRMVLQKAPGAAAVQTVYDERDRVVFTQDGNQAAQTTPQWTVHTYDELDRPTVMALYNTTESIEDLQNDIANSVVATSVTVNNPGQAVVDLVVDNRQGSTPTQYKAQNSITFVTDAGGSFESATGDNFETILDPSAATQPITVTTYTYRNPVNLTASSGVTILKYVFYDDYTYSGAKTFDNSFNNTVAYSNSDPNIDPIVASVRLQNIVTGTLVRVLGTNTFLTTSTYYDEKGRPIQTLADNIKSGQDVTTLQYHFCGRIMSTYSKHSTPYSGYTNFGVLTKNVYDNIGRVSQVLKKYEYNSNDFITAASYEYDDLGQVKTKHLDPNYSNATTGKTELESLTYSYNIHGSVTGVNRDYALKAAGNYDKWGNYFGFCLGYDDRDNVFGRSNLTGKIVGQIWNTQGDDAQRKYDYTYNNAGWLVNASYTERQLTSNSWSAGTMDFSVTGSGGQVQYDLNGNITSMIQKGVLPGSTSPITVDDLTYHYFPLSNKLEYVSDNATLGSLNGKYGDFKDGSNGSADDYVYDNNGNLVIDLNKNVKELNNVTGANGISYNYLDKPEQIHVSGKGTIQIVYDADGNKLQRTFTPEPSGTATTTSYIGQYVYVGNALQYINFEEGRIRVIQPLSQSTQGSQGNTLDALQIDGNIDLPNGMKGVYDFFVRDYLGNVRNILTEETHTGYNTCTMETARAGTEEPIFGQVDASGNISGSNEVITTRFDVNQIPGQLVGSGWQNSNIGAEVSRLSKLNGLSIGPNSLLKVMAGDEISATTQYYYQSYTTNNSNDNLTADVVAALTQMITNGAATGGSITHPEVTNIGNNLNGSTVFGPVVDPNRYTQDDYPRAYLNVVFFDERFNFIQEGSISSRVDRNAVNDNNASLLLANIKAPKNGYVYVYVSNESDEAVYFDNLQIGDVRGRLVEEDAYYPFGLKIAEISSKKLGSVQEGMLENKSLYTDRELMEDGDVDLYDFGARYYDAQIGRWHVPDPAHQFASPYEAMNNDPVAFTDPNGKFSWWVYAIGAIVGGAANVFANKGNGGDFGNFLSGAIGAVADMSFGPYVGFLTGAAGSVINDAIDKKSKYDFGEFAEDVVNGGNSALAGGNAAADAATSYDGWGDTKGDSRWGGENAKGDYKSKFFSFIGGGGYDGNDLLDFIGKNLNAGITNALNQFGTDKEHKNRAWDNIGYFASGFAASAIGNWLFPSGKGNVNDISVKSNPIRGNFFSRNFITNGLQAGFNNMISSMDKNSSFGSDFGAFFQGLFPIYTKTDGTTDFSNVFADFPVFDWKKR